MVECCLTALVEAAESRGGGDWGGDTALIVGWLKGGTGKRFIAPLA